MNTATLFSTGKDDWQTPPELFAQLNAEFAFTLDGAANASNHLVEAWFGPGSPYETDALQKSWMDEVVYVNPPYSRGLQGRFIEKAAMEAEWFGATVVMLIPARTDTKAFHAHIWDAEKHQPRPGVEVRFLKGRVKFVGATAGAPFPSMICIFRGQSA